MCVYVGVCVCVCMCTRERACMCVQQMCLCVVHVCMLLGIQNPVVIMVYPWSLMCATPLVINVCYPPGHYMVFC